MQALFIAIHLSLLAYFIGRRFDLITVAFYTSSVYFLPAYVGYSCYDARNLSWDPLGTGTYLFYITYYVVLFLCSLVVQAPPGAARPGPAPTASDVVQGNARLLHFLAALRWIVPVLLLAAQFLTPGGLWKEDKQDLLDSASMAFPAFQDAAAVYLVIAAVCKRRLDVLVGAVYCLIDLSLSFRLVTAFVFFALLTIYVMQRRNKSIALNCLVPVVIAGAFLFGSVYKAILFHYLVDGISGITSYLGDAGAIGESFSQNEAFSQQHIFNKVLETDFHIPADYPFNMARLFFPGLANTLFGKNLSFNDYFQPALYPEVPWGMASNIWAEQYSAGGAIWLYVFLLGFAVALTFTNKIALGLLATGKIDWFLFVVVMTIPVLIFMHRNDLLYELVLVRNMAFLLIVIGFLPRVFSSTTRTRPVIAGLSGTVSAFRAK